MAAEGGAGVVGDAVGDVGEPMVNQGTFKVRVLKDGWTAVTQDGKLAIYIVLATIPAVAFGLFLKKFGLGDLERSVTIVAWNTVIYGILMLIADMIGRQEKTIENMTLKSALFIGVAQALALIPGTSRSGITMTAARFLNYTRPDAARGSRWWEQVPTSQVYHAFNEDEEWPGLPTSPFQRALPDIESFRLVMRQLHGHLNRVLNAETANLERTVASSARQIALINSMTKTPPMTSSSSSLRVTRAP